VANVDGRPRTDAHGAVEALIRQVSAPVQWQACVEQLLELGVRRFVEVGPGAALSGMVKRIAKDATIVKFGTPEDLDEVMAACSN
jgi:[acyl-carrier-protein] S-malonyltransferase